MIERLLMRFLPYFEITGEDGSIYLRRFYLYRGKKRPHIFLHHILRSDDDRALHDHPWAFTSIMLSGRYTEISPFTDQRMESFYDVRFDPCYGGHLFSERIRAFAIIRHKAQDRHRLYLNPGETVWTLVFAGERERDWGFWMHGEFTHWKKFTEKMKGMAGRC